MVVTYAHIHTHTQSHTHLKSENMKTHLQNSFILERKDKTERKYHDFGVGARGQRDCCSPTQTFQQLSKILQFGDQEKKKRNATQL